MYKIAATLWGSTVMFGMLSLMFVFASSGQNSGCLDSFEYCYNPGRYKTEGIHVDTVAVSGTYRKCKDYKRRTDCRDVSYTDYYAVYSHGKNQTCKTPQTRTTIGTKTNIYVYVDNPDVCMLNTEQNRDSGIISVVMGVLAVFTLIIAMIVSIVYCRSRDS